ncbi:DUF397 domain-containing protein [Streptomyces sp. SM1]|uniref:DUF397 domain-containing protein n=1 Tax=Streptomyces sp. SM1 TaxID=402229 RepID=UPI000CD4CA8E|nr:DUF397 domain-containing protein [Streptomyces sp. SM1]
MSRTADPDAFNWRKSSYSDGGADNCVEVADGLPDVVPVRDSKAPHGPVLRFPVDVWTAFLGTFSDSGRPTA